MGVEARGFLKGRSVWFYGLWLGIALIAFGMMIPWWCRGHYSLRCTNGLGLSWETVFSGRNLDVNFNPSISTLIFIFLISFIWLEFKKPIASVKVKRGIASVIFVIAIVATVLFVREINNFVPFTGWTTDIFYGAWTTLIGALIVLVISFFTSVQDKS